MSAVADIVLDESLLREFFNFFQLKVVADRKKLTKLLEYYKPFFITVAQLEEFFPDKMIIQQLLATKNHPWVTYAIPATSTVPKDKVFSNELLEEMVLASHYKICLTDKKVQTGLPYRGINILDTKVKANYTERFATKQSRTDLHTQLTFMLKVAKKVEIYDYYLKENDLKTFAALIDSNCKSNIDVHILTNTTEMTDVTRKSINDTFKECKSVRIALYKKAVMHDRYIKIDDKIEILISSGFEYLFKDNKECTYVISKIK